jgi:hypothetical protein
MPVGNPSRKMKRANLGIEFTNVSEKEQLLQSFCTSWFPVIPTQSGEIDRSPSLDRRERNRTGRFSAPTTRKKSTGELQ